MKIKQWLLGAVALVSASSLAVAQQTTITVPGVTAVQSTDYFQDIQNGNVGQGNKYATAAQMGNLAFQQASAAADNMLVGGDFYANTYAHGATSGTINTTLTYGPSDWFLWSGTSTNLVSTQQTGAADTPANFLASNRVTRSSTGVVQSCIAQEVESAIAVRAQGQVAEFDFHALAGAGFSDAAGALHVYISYGTATDEGSTKMAFGINAGVGSTAWTGQVNLGGTAGYTVPITAAWQRFTVAAPIPTTAKEIGVAICWTPVGASPSNDYFEFEGAQLVINPSLGALAGTSGAYLGASVVGAKSYVRRNSAYEVVQQERYVFNIAEANTVATVQAFGLALGSSTTLCSATIPFPVTMRAAPTYTNALSATTFTITSSSQAATVLATPFSATKGANTVAAASINFTTAGMTAKDACMLTSTAAGGGSMVWSAEL